MKHQRELACPTVGQLKKRRYHELAFANGACVWYQFIGREKYSALFQRESSQQLLWMPGITADSFFWWVDSFRSPKKGFLPVPGEADESFLQEHPLYQQAIENDDLLLQLQLRVYYQLATNKECRELSDLLGELVLQQPDKALDREFHVRVTENLEAILSRSGYRILHRPFFAMKGCTHRIWQINPYKRICVDAAPADIASISPGDYLGQVRKN